MRVVCRHYNVPLIELHDIDKQNGHPSVSGMQSICDQLLEAVDGVKGQACCPSALDVIMSRTSIRSFTGEPVSKAQLETLLKAGMAAPTAMNGQPWRFVVVTDKEKIAKVFGAGPRSEMFSTAGAVIVVCGQTSSMFWYEDCSAAAENILLAATAEGLGAVWTAGYPAEERIAPIAAALGIPADVKPLCIIPVGVPAEHPAPKDKWKPENIHWEQW